MKFEEATKYIHDAVNFCNSHYSIECPVRELCADIFDSTFVCQDFLKLAKRCQKFVERGGLDETIL